MVDGTRHMADADDKPIPMPPCPCDRYIKKDGVYQKTPEWETYCAARDEAIKLSTHEVEMPIKLQFAHIDSKDCSVVHTNQTEYAHQKKNQAVLAIAEHEYLTKLRALQVEMDEKYGPMLEPEGSDVEPDEDLKSLAKETNLENSLRLDLYYH